jgi:hypothetical protein
VPAEPPSRATTVVETPSQPPPSILTTPPSTNDCAQEMLDTMDRGSLYEHDIPSLSASLEAFDPDRSMHSAYSGRSNMHSSRWSVPQEDAESETESDGPWAPPAWQKSHSSNHWYRKSLLGESAARGSPSKSPFEYRTDREVTPSRIPLPESPYKQTPRTSPEPISEEEQYMHDNIASRMQSPEQEAQVSAGAQQGNEMALSHHDETGPVEGCE